MSSKKQMMLILGIVLVGVCRPLQAMDAEKKLLNQGLVNEVKYGVSRHGNTNQLVWLIEEGAEVNYQDESGETALMVAAYIGNLKIARLLIEKGAQLDLQNVCGYTALMSAVEENHPEIVHLLIEKGAQANLQNKYGNTALAYAKVSRLEILIEAMLKLTKEQKDSVYALIASLERTPSVKTSKDTRKLIAQDLIDMYKKENLAKTRAEIEKIQKNGLRNHLLQLLEEK